MSEFFESLVPIIAIIGTIAVPITLIENWAKVKNREKQKDEEVKRLIIEHDIDLERAEMLVHNGVHIRKNPITMLRFGLALVFMGLAVPLIVVVHLPIYINIIIVSAGMGLGLLLSFIIEMKYADKFKKMQE